MTDEEFEKWLLNVGFPEEVQEMIRFNRNAPPARQVRSSGRNVVVRYVGTKNGETTSCESQLEVARAMRLDREPDVLEYRSQRPIYTVNYTDSAGKNGGSKKICDFFVLRQNGVEMIECKPEKILVELSKKNPGLFTRDANNKWICPPGDAFAKSCGFTFTVFSSADVNYKFDKNAEFLFDYYVGDPPPVPPDVEERIVAIVGSQIGITYFTLTQKHEINPNHLNMLIATNKLYVDLDKELLADSKEVHVYLDETAAKEHVVRDRGLSPHLQDIHAVNMTAGEKIKWDQTQWTIVSVDSAHVSLYAEDGTVIKPKLASIEQLIRQGDIIGLNKSPAKQDTDEQYDKFYRRAGKSEWKILNRRQAVMNKIKGDKGGINGSGNENEAA